MEGALTQVTEELTRSRADYTALFQNFKQSRILFEERELASKAHVQRVLKENSVLEGALKQLTGELNLCRSDYSALAQNFESSNILSEERDEVCRATIQQLSEQYEGSKKKISEQKIIMKAQRATERDFENDLQKFEQATKFYGSRETNMVERLDTATAFINKLKEELYLNSKIITKQLTDIETLNEIISDEMVAKHDYDRIRSEKDGLQRILDSETVSVKVHQNLKEKYAKLQSRVESSMVNADEYGMVAAKYESLKHKIDKDYVTRMTYAQVQDNYQLLLEEKKVLNDEKINLSISLSDAESKIILLKAQLEESEKNLAAAHAAEDFRLEISHIENERQHSLDRSIAEQRNVLSMNSIRKERRTIDLMEGSFKSIENELLNENQRLREDYLRVRESHEVEVRQLKEDFRDWKESEVVKNENIIQQMKIRHSDEITAISDSNSKNLIMMARDVEQNKIAVEAAHNNNLATMLTLYQTSEETAAVKYENNIKLIKETAHRDQMKNFDRTLVDLRESFNNEISGLNAQLLRAEEAIKVEGKRADLSVTELFRIENEYKMALSSIEKAYNDEISKAESYNADTALWKQHAELAHVQLSVHKKEFISLVQEKEKMSGENRRLREVACNFENDSRVLRCELEEVKDAVLESVSSSINAHPLSLPLHTMMSDRSRRYLDMGSSD